MPINPALAVRGPKHVVKTGKTPVLNATDWRKLLDSIPTDTVRDLRDRALIATRTSRGHDATAITVQPMNQSDAWRMIRRRAVAAGIHAPIGNHRFRATGITAYLANGGALGHAQEMAAHESPRTTKLYNRTKERLTQDEVERIRL